MSPHHSNPSSFFNTGKSKPMMLCPIKVSAFISTNQAGKYLTVSGVQNSVTSCSITLAAIQYILVGFSPSVSISNAIFNVLIPPVLRQLLIIYLCRYHNVDVQSLLFHLCICSLVSLVSLCSSSIHPRLAGFSLVL